MKVLTGPKRPDLSETFPDFQIMISHWPPSFCILSFFGLSSEHGAVLEIAFNFQDQMYGGTLTCLTQTGESFLRTLHQRDLASHTQDVWWRWSGSRGRGGGPCSSPGYELSVLVASAAFPQFFFCVLFSQHIRHLLYGKSRSKPPTPGPKPRGKKCEGCVDSFGGRHNVHMCMSYDKQTTTNNQKPTTATAEQVAQE